MSAQVTLEHVRDAYQAGDPELVNLFVRLMRDVEQPLQPPPREGVYRFEDFLVETQSSEFRRQPLDQQAQYRMEKLAKLESDDAEEPLSDRLRSHTLLLEMWEANDRFSRNCLIKLIAELPLVYGPFKALKQIFKEAEASDDTEVFGALSARFDLALSTRSHQVSQRTLAYLARRGWRYLRRIGETFPAIYPDVVTDFLIHYQGYAYQFRDTWILNHIFFHEKKIHTRTKFPLGYQVPKSWRKHRAFDDLWRRSPRPLFSLLQHSRCEPIIEYAADCLKSDFRAALRDVEASWVARLTSANVEAIDSFVVWILNNVPKFEQSKFRDLGLHDAVLKLFDSEARDAKRYAANYARTYARDLPVDRLIQLINSYDSEVRKLATDLIQARDPRQEIGIDAWGELLQTERGRKIAEEALRKNFGASELTPEWFASRLQTQDESTLEFARQRLLQLHSRESLGWQYFAEVIEQVDDENWLGSDTVDFCCDQLEKLTIAEIPVDRLQRLLMHPNARQRVTDWIEMGKLKASLLGVDFLKMLAYQPSFDSDSRIAEMRQFEWGKSSLDFNESLAAQVMVWLKDVRQFSPSDLGFDWLLQLVQRSEPLYHDFATETLTKSFVPADFASEETASEETVSEDGDTESDASGEAGEINIDLEGASFVFTGKLATMTRSGAQGMVTTAGGANSTSVTKKLDYLVIGDDGSPLYGQGRK
ncbi:MAG: BRCT domain-containing protein [Planctomycetota bacterium]